MFRGNFLATSQMNSASELSYIHRATHVYLPGLSQGTEWCPRKLPL